MKKTTLNFIMIMLLSSTCISAFANNPKDTPMPITGVLDIPIHKSLHISSFKNCRLDYYKSKSLYEKPDNCFLDKA